MAKSTDSKVGFPTDGSTAIADAVVGCDGIRSVVRKILFGQDHEASRAVFSGVSATGASLIWILLSRLWERSWH